MRDTLPNRVHSYECGIVNLDTDSGSGTHWVGYKKENNTAVYFDSFGNLRPPKEVVSYLRSSGPCKILYNHDRFQLFTSMNCGHLVLQFLFHLTPPLSF